MSQFANGLPHILLVVTLPHFGGAQTHVLELIDGFRGRFNLSLATSAEGHLTEEARARGVSIHLLPSLQRSVHPFSDIQAVRECAALIGRITPDLIHAHSSKAGVVARVAGKLCGVPVVYTAHGWAFAEGAPAGRRIMAYVVETLAGPISSKVICVSRSDAALAKRAATLRNGRMTTIVHGLSDHDAPRASPAVNPPRLLMVARFSQQKDHATFLRAISQLKTENHSFTADLVGSGTEMEHCRRLAEQLGVADIVTFYGDRTDVTNLYAKSQVFVLSTHYEGMPLSVLEAMRAGLPVVATNVNGIPEAVSDDVTGMLVARGDVEGLTQALGRLIASPELRARMGNAARARFLAEFGAARMLSEVERVYRAAAPSRQLSPA